MRDSRALTFWGKTYQQLPTIADCAPNPNLIWKPVLHHLLDVAAAALALEFGSPTRLRREAQIWRTSPKSLAYSRAYLAALHDLGKVSRAFQSKRLDLWPAALGEPPQGEHRASHWVLTGKMLQHRRLAHAVKNVAPNLDSDHRLPILAAIAGHHGQPPVRDATSPLARADANRLVGDPSFAAAEEIVARLAETLRPKPLLALDGRDAATAFSWRLAGLITLADWVGSDGAAFPSLPHDTPIDEYWRKARASAASAVRAKGLVASKPARSGGMRTLFPEIAAPRPMQEHADRLNLPDGPVLAILEDATGSGKTEAALALASRIIAAGKAEGAYVALPTMATADAMFGRLTKAVARLFAPGACPSIALAHGKAHLSTAFATVRGQSNDASAQCAEWIADDRRRAFFADVGAGTIDQALLAVLPKRFLTLRQHGLAGRVLIIDEAHAFDPYMDEEIKRLLEMQASAGGSAIVLSATLPKAKRLALATAFRKGLNQAAPTLRATDYPLATLVGHASVDETPIAPAASLKAAVLVERIGAEATAIERSYRAAMDGAAVLWVRNAVDDAIGAATALREKGVAVDLFHARFAMCDRRRIEDSVVGRYGKDGSVADRRGRVLVSTQVCESSLDLDLDLLISDLAPVDAVIQRAGRIWRHMDRRPAAARPLDRPRLLLLAPDPDAVESAAWVHEIQQKGGFVYPDAGVLWRTARELVRAGEIRAPEGLRGLIEAVFADGAETPEPLRAAEAKAHGEDYAAITHARGLLIDRLSGYGGMAEIQEDQEIGTRLGRPTVTLRLARCVGGALKPWADEASPQRAWAMSEVVAPANWLGRDGDALRPPAEFASLIDAAKSDWPKWERATLAVVDGADGALALQTQTGERPLIYGPETGLRRCSLLMRG